MSNKIKWTEEEIAFIKKNYKNFGINFCAERLKRSSASVRRKANELKIVRKIKKPRLHHAIKNSFWLSLNNGAKTRNLLVEITIDDVWNLYIKQNKKCALTGWDINFSNKKGETTASVDRIDSSKGYVKDNVQLVHKDINRFKMAFSEKDFYNMCKSVYLHLVSQPDREVENFKKYQIDDLLLSFDNLF